MSYTCNQPIIIAFDIINEKIAPKEIGSSNLNHEQHQLKVLIKCKKEDLDLFTSSKINFLIMGTRIGFRNHRLIEKSKDEFEKNENFWKTIGKKDFIVEN